MKEVNAFDTIAPKKRQIFHAVNRERYYQDEKWGTVKSNPHDLGVWMDLMEEELDEAKKSYATGPLNEVETLREILQLISVGVACLEQHGAHER